MRGWFAFSCIRPARRCWSFWRASLIAGIGVFVHFYNTYSKLIDHAAARRSLQHDGPHFRRARIRSRWEMQLRRPILRPRSGTRVITKTATTRSDPTPCRPIRSISFPGADSYFDQEPATVKFSRGKIARIVSLRDNTDRPLYELEPQLITNLYDRNREKQRVVHYEDIPAGLRNAILSAEDKRFFQHSGFDPIGVMRSAWVDLKRGRNEQGASTLSMQLARDMFLTPDAQLAAQAGRDHDHDAARTEAHERADLRDVL